jgi:hypothetical protein
LQGVNTQEAAVRVFQLPRAIILCALALCLLHFISSGAYTSPILYPDVPGTHVKYTGISEDITGSASISGFGQPTGSGDILDFPTSSFYTESKYVNGSTTADSFLQLTITSLNNATGISHITFDESGDYKLIRPGPPTTSDPWNAVTGIAFLTIWDAVDTSTPFTPFTIPITTFINNEYHLTGSQDYTMTDWEGTLNFDVTQFLRDQGYQTGYATRVTLKLDNSLTSTSDVNSYSYIRKKDVTLTTDVVDVPVPEPSILIMLSMVALSMGIWLRNKRY